MQPVRQIKEMIALAMLAVSAYTDIREGYIYLVPLAAPVAGSVVITLVLYLFCPGLRDRGIIVTELMIPAMIGLFFIFLAGSQSAHIGPGDGYLAAALVLVAGFKCGLISMIAGSVAASGYALFVRISGKKHRRSIPFAPFIMAGYFFVLICDV